MLYDSIKGTVSFVCADFIAVDVNNIGYRVHIPLHLYSSKLLVGEPIFLFVSQIVREDSEKLYGFLERSERDVFEKLLNVSGIGAKTALLLIGRMQLSNLTYAIKSQDAQSLSRVPGIGKKTAERIIIELADKMDLWHQETSSQDALPAESAVTNDALSALMNLGYSLSQSKKAVEKALSSTKSKELSCLISSALREL